jgi:hypothetical protein
MWIFGLKTNHLATLYSHFARGKYLVTKVIIGIKMCRGLFNAIKVVVAVGFRVARWLVFKPKIHIWVNFGGSCNGKSWHIL